MPSTKVELLPARIALEDVTPMIAAVFADDACLIWSGEWQAYWRAGGNGYTKAAAEAGWYTIQAAYERTRHCDPSKQIMFERVPPSYVGEELREAAQFLSDRLDDLEWIEGDLEATLRDFMGHVDPAHARLKSLLASPPPVDRAEAGEWALIQRVRHAIQQHREAPFRSADWLANELMTICDTAPANDTAQPLEGLTSGEGKTHNIKCWPDVFEEMRAGRKTAEFRYNDRGYAVGDMLLIREWDTATAAYTHREITRQITHVLDGGFGMPAGYVMLSLAASPSQPTNEGLTSGEGEPVAWCSPGQLANLTDVDRDGGVYLPIRKTKRGNFTMPLYAASPSNHAGSVRVAVLEEAARIADAFARGQAQMIDEEGPDEACRGGKEVGEFIAKAIRRAALHPIDSRAAQEKA